MNSVPFAGLDRVERHAGRLQRGRAVAREGRPRQRVIAQLDGHVAGHVEALLAAGKAASENEIVDVGRVERRDLVECGSNHRRRQIVGAQVDQRTLAARPMGERAVATMTASGIAYVPCL